MKNNNTSPQRETFTQLLDRVTTQSKDSRAFCPAVDSRPEFFVTENSTNKIEHQRVDNTAQLKLGDVTFSMDTPTMLASVFSLKKNLMPFPLCYYGLN